MRLTLSEYWDHQVDALKKRAVLPEPLIGRSECLVLIDETNPYKGSIDARVWFDDDAFLDIVEFVEIDIYGRPHRLSYSYHLQVDGQVVERHDFDPALDDPRLRHHINRTRKGESVHIPSERTSLAKMVDQCWGLIVQERVDVPRA